MITKVATKSHEEWKELRSKYIGGSDAASVVGLNPFSSAYTLWAEKTGKVPSFEGNLATEVGTFLEEFVAKKFEEETGKKVRKENHSILNDQYPWAIANVDRVIVGENAGLEIKTTDSMNLSKFKNGEYPSNYYVQCVHYLALTGKDRWYLAVLIGNKEFKTFTIERDQEEIDALMKSEEEFWRYVQTNTPPPPDGAESTSKTLSSIYPNSNGGTADISPFNNDLFEYTRLNAQIKELEKMRDEAANRVKLYLGETGEGESTRYKVYWKTAQRSSFDTKRFVKDHSDMDLSGYYNHSSYKTFKVTEKKEK